MDEKQTVLASIDAIWRRGELGRLGEFWSDGCVNHAAVPTGRGLDALTAYHQAQFEAFADFVDAQIEVVQQVGEGERVVTHMVTSAVHRPSGKAVHMATMRIDRVVDGHITEHWSVADEAGLLRQLAG